LADELAAGGFKLRPFLREVALTRTYQRSCDAPRPEIVNFADVAARLERLTQAQETQQQSLQALKEAVAEAKDEFKTARAEDARLAAELPKLEKLLADVRQALDKAAAERKSSEEALAIAREQASLVAKAASKLSEVATKLPEDKVVIETNSKLATRSQELNAAADAAERVAGERLSQHTMAVTQQSEAEKAIELATASRLTQKQLRELEQAQLTAEHRLADAAYGVAEINAQITTAKAILDYAALAETDSVKAAAAWSSLVERWTIAGQIAALKPLTPEQMAASAMQASGVLAPQYAAAIDKAQKSSGQPIAVRFLALRIGGAAPDGQTPLDAKLAELDLLNQLRGTFREFVRQYGGEPGQEFQATVNQALFFGNGTIIDGWLKPAGDNLAAQLLKLDDAGQIADQMCWAVFSRKATESEREAASAYLKDRGDKPTAIGEMVWALLSSTEFRFNH
jgi:hypothetical protein